PALAGRLPDAARRPAVSKLLSAGWWDGVRRAATRAALHGALTLGRWLGPRALLEGGRAAGGPARPAGALPARPGAHLRHARAGIVPTEERLDAWFRRFGTWAGWSLAVFQAGLEGSGLAERISFDESVAHLDDAVARGRGVVLAAPHLACHEITAGFLHRRHPV